MSFPYLVRRRDLKNVHKGRPNRAPVINHTPPKGIRSSKDVRKYRISPRFFYWLRLLFSSIELDLVAILMNSSGDFDTAILQPFFHAKCLYAILSTSIELSF